MALTFFYPFDIHITTVTVTLTFGTKYNSELHISYKTGFE